MVGAGVGGVVLVTDLVPPLAVGRCGVGGSWWYGLGVSCGFWGLWVALVGLLAGDGFGDGWWV